MATAESSTEPSGAFSFRICFPLREQVDADKRRRVAELPGLQIEITLRDDFRLRRRQQLLGKIDERLDGDFIDDGHRDGVFHGVRPDVERFAGDEAHHLAHLRGAKSFGNRDMDAE